MPVQDNCTITPVISKSSADFIEGLVKDAEGKGAKLMQKYRREGNLIWPVLLDHVTPVSVRCGAIHERTVPIERLPFLSSCATVDLSVAGMVAGREAVHKTCTAEG